MLQFHPGCSEPRIPTTNRGNLFVVLGGVLALLLACCPLARAQGQWHQTEFMIGTWEDPVTLSGNDLHALKLAKDAYFNLLTCTVVHYDGPSGNYIVPCDHLVHSIHPHFRNDQFGSIHYPKLQAAGQLGLKVLVTHDQITFAGGTAPDFNDNPTFPAQLFPLYGADALTNEQNDGLLGYNMGDEPDFNCRNGSFIKSWVAAIHADGHYRAAYVNVYSGCGNALCPEPTYAENVALLTNDLDPNRQIDVVSTDLYPFWASQVSPGCVVNYWTAMRDVRATMGGRPFWIITMASPSAAGEPGPCGPFSDPDEYQSRFMAFCPVAAGAKGILWFDYRSYPLNPFLTPGNVDYPVLGNDIPTCKYYRLKTINHYLHEVLGPVVMSKNHLGVFHQGNPSDLPLGIQGVIPDMLISSPQAAPYPPSDLGNPNFLVGVFRPPSVLNEYYLLVVNKAPSSQSGSVTLRASYSIGASPSVIGYVGGSAFTPIGTGTSFAVSLAGGEGRLYHLTPAPTSDIALTAPLGGETWRAGESHTVTWSPSSAVVDIDLVADALESGTEITGPNACITCNGPVSGGSYTFTVPPIWSRAAHIVVTLESGAAIQSHNAPIITAPVEPPNSSWSFDAAGCVTLGGTLAVDATGHPAVAYTRFPLELRVARFDGSTWNSTAPMDQLERTSGTGVSADLAFDASNRPHVAHLTRVVLDNTRELWHSYQNASNAWANEQVVVDDGFGNVVGVFASPRANCALAISAIDVVVAFRGDEADGKNLKVLRKAGSKWVDFCAEPLPVLINPHDISLATDASNNVYVACIDGDPSGGPGRSDQLVVLKITPSAATCLMCAETPVIPSAQFGTVSMSLDSNGQPAIAYTQDFALDGVRRLRYCAYNGSSWGPTRSVESDTYQTIADCALAFEGTHARIAYVSNRVAKYARDNDSGTLFELSPVYSSADGEGPVALRFYNGSRWISFFDRSAGQYRVVGPASGGGGGGIDPSEMEAIHMLSNNPVVRGGSLKFDLRLSREARLEMGLFDVAGRRVARFSPQTLAPGQRQVQWQLGLVRPGAYFLRVSRDGGVVLRRSLVVLN